MGYVPSTPEERSVMLATVGARNYDDLFKIIPENLRFKGSYEHISPDGLSEFEVYDEISKLAEANKNYRAIFRGAGAYNHLIPACVTHLSSLPEFVTAYTPYQPEISQGVLEAIFEYQSAMCALTGLDVSNASVYDGATAAAEAVSMCREKGKRKAVVSAGINPQTLSVLKTYARAFDLRIVMCPLGEDGATDTGALKAVLDDGVACAYVESPNYFGVIEDCETLSFETRKASAKFIVGVNPISLGVLYSPAEYDADIAVGDGQPLGMPLSFGGPYLGFMTCRSEHMRKLPGRIVGQTTDAEGRRAFVLTLQAREQHIRREKALSNICSNQALCALTAAIYCSAMGPVGLREVATSCMANAAYLCDKLSKIGLKRAHTADYFHEFVTECPTDAKMITAALDGAGILGGAPVAGNRILWCATEANNRDQIDELVNIAEGVIRNA